MHSKLSHGLAIRGYLYNTLGLPQCVTAVLACSPEISELCMNVCVCKLVSAPERCVLFYWLSIEIILPFLLTKDLFCQLSSSRTKPAIV